VAAAQQQAAAALGHTLGLPGSPFQAFQPQSPAALYAYPSPHFQQNSAGFTAGFTPHPTHDGGDVIPANNRCIYFGQLADEVTTEDICNAVRGGQLLQVKFIPDKHIAVSFRSAWEYGM
jgi:hypothetical protein